MIFISDTPIEEPLKKLLQQKVKIHLNNKVWRAGRLILFKQSGFYLEFTMKSNKRERFEVPIPYDIIFDEKNLVMYFDYRFSTLVYDDKESLKLIESITKEKRSRFYDTMMEIEIISDVK